MQFLRFGFVGKYYILTVVIALAGVVMSEYEEQRKKEKQLTKDLALADLKDMMSKLPKEKANAPAIVVGTKTFTPAEMQKEVENDTEYGKEFAKILAKSRVELARRRKQ